MRRLLKIAAWTLGAVSMGLVLLVALLLALANTDAGRRQIESLTSRLSAGAVHITGLAGTVPWDLRLETLELRDAGGVWLEADQLALRWSPLALLHGVVHIGSLEVARLHVERAPAAGPAPVSSGSVLSRVPHIDVDALEVARLELGAPLAGAAATLSLNGALHWRSLEDARADLKALRIDAAGDYALVLSFDPRRMTASLGLHEPADGPLENLLKVPGLGKLSALVTLSGPRTLENVSVAIEAGELRARAQGSLDLTQRSADLAYSLTSPAMRLRPDLQWERLDLEGRWRGTLDAASADGTLRVEGLRLPGGAALARLDAGLKAAAGSISAHAVASGVEIPRQPQLLRADPLTVDAVLRPGERGRPLTLTASHRLFSLHAEVVTAGVQSASFDGRLPSLAPFAQLLGQELRGSASLTGRIVHSKRAWQLALSADSSLEGGGVPEVVGPRATLKMAAALSAAALDVQQFELNGQSLSLTLKGSARRAPAGAFEAVSARWQLAIPQLHALSPALAGKLNASGSVDGPLDSFSGDAELSATLAVRDSPPGTIDATLHAGGLPRAPRGSVAAHGMLDGAPLDVDLTLQGDGAGGTELHAGRAAWKSARAFGDLALDANANASGRLHLQVGRLADLSRLLGVPLDGNFAADAALSQEHGHAALQISDVAAEVRGIRIRSLESARLAAAGGVSIEHLRLALGNEAHPDQATLKVDGRVSPVFDLRASLTGVGPELVNQFAPGLLRSGSLEAAAVLAGTPAVPAGRVTLVGRDLRLSAASESLPALELRAGAQLADRAATVDVRLGAGGTGNSDALSLTGRVPFEPDAALDLKIGGELNAELVNPLLEASGQHASGRLVVAGTIGGRWAAPQIAGSVHIAQGTLRDYGRGFALTDITAILNARDDALQIESLTATAGTGTVSLTGSIGVLEPKVPLNLVLKARNARPIASKLFTANLDADLTVTGNTVERLKVAGHVQLNRATVGIPSSFPPNVAVLDVRRPWRHDALPPANPLIVEMDVAVKAPQEFLVQGRGLDAALGGEIHLGGTTAEPQVSGDFELQRGTFDVAGRKLQFTEGSVRFDGADLQKRIDPLLDFTAQSSLADSTATLKITGRADSPHFDITSSPPLPTDEIMARLLFGEAAAQLTALQLAQVGASLATITGIGGDSLNPLVKLQQTLGLDRLSVGAATTVSTAAGGTQSNGTAIEAGRYLSKRVYIEARQSSTGTSQLQADVTLTKHLKLQTRLGNGTALQGTTPENDPGSSLGLSYTLEY
jgi:translocation and assembly module TamB